MAKMTVASIGMERPRQRRRRMSQPVVSPKASPMPNPIPVSLWGRLGMGRSGCHNCQHQSKTWTFHRLPFLPT